MSHLPFVANVPSSQLVRRQTYAARATRGMLLRLIGPFDQILQKVSGRLGLEPSSESGTEWIKCLNTLN